jgi:ribosomal protein S18 acetylase RimI-like enzyme
MEPSVRPARPEDRAAPGLLYASAAPYYDAYAGGERRALHILERIWERPGHTASYELCHVAELDGQVVGALVAFPSAEGDRLARRFLALSLPRMPVWHWPKVLRHLRASTAVTPVPPPDALYVDALAVDESARRRGVARALLAEADRIAARSGLACVALDTGLENAGARALYAALGFEQASVHRAPTDKVARAVGGTGFVSFVRAVRATGTAPRRTGR